MKISCSSQNSSLLKSGQVPAHFAKVLVIGKLTQDFLVQPPCAILFAKSIPVSHPCPHHSSGLKPLSLVNRPGLFIEKS